jgi:thiosulfate/3-mercaptopyruvate sulfurtransferase
MPPQRLHQSLRALALDSLFVELPGPLVEASWLAARLGAPGLVVADVRWYAAGGGRAAYLDGHLPGAVFADVDVDLAAPRTPGSGRHPLPTPEAFAEAMSRLGIGGEDAVVAYDDAGGANAARLWWMLDATRHRAAVLDGGIQAWTGPLEQGPVTRPGAAFPVRPWPADRIADPALVDRLRRDPDAAVLDARSSERYRGEVEPIDPVAGHIPGARSAPFAGNLDPATGRFLSPDALRNRYQELVGGRDEVVAYCGSGVTSCHILLARRVAGLPDGRLYPGSWSEWIADPSRPVAVGEEP